MFVRISFKLRVGILQKAVLKRQQHLFMRSEIYTAVRNRIKMTGFLAVIAFKLMNSMKVSEKYICHEDESSRIICNIGINVSTTSNYISEVRYVNFFVAL